MVAQSRCSQSQLYILLPVLDNAKHYWVSPDEVDKLMRRGSGWLEDHPERELIVRRYLMTRRAFVRACFRTISSTGPSRGMIA